jgi:hypothetical protein
VLTRKRYKLAGVKWNEWTAGLPQIEWREDDNTIECLTEELHAKMKSSTYDVQQTSGIYNLKYSKPWWNPECGRLVAIRRRAKNIFMGHPTEANLRDLRHAENMVKREVVRAKKNRGKSLLVV